MAHTIDDVLRISKDMKVRGEDMIKPRERQNQENWQAYRGEQDWSHKADYQSQETTPTFPLSIEQIVGTFERALTDTDDWAAADRVGLGTPLLPTTAIQNLVMFFMSRLYVPGDGPDTEYSIQQYVGDSIKRGLLEPKIIAKVYPMLKKRTRFMLVDVEPTDDGDQPIYALTSRKVLQKVEEEVVRIAVDVVAYQDYGEDPSPLNRWRYHRMRRSLSELKANPEYDQAAVDRLFAAATTEEQDRERRDKTGDPHTPPQKSEVEVFEFWGDLIDEQSGEVLEHNVWWAVAGDEVIRPVSENPNADGSHPFVVSAILRVPDAKIGKALADHAVPMWRLNNELINLAADQALRAAWGVGQLRTDIMEHPEEVAGGVPQGYTAVLRPNAPQNVKFYERVDNGEAPQISLEMLNRTAQEVQTALAIPDSRLGQLPQRQVKATELVQALQSSGSLYESFAARYEDTHLEPIFEKVWRNIIQYVDDFIEEEIVAAIGARLTLILSSLEPEDRWQMLHLVHFKVRGLRGVASREKRFNKLVTVLNMIQQNPALLEFFQRTKDMDKLFDEILKATGIDPETFDIDEAPVPETDEQAADQLVAAEGQLDPRLVAAASGASAPGAAASVPEQRGAESGFAPNNPAAQGAGVGAV
jgi:hypothetical protein